MPMKIIKETVTGFMKEVTIYEKEFEKTDYGNNYHHAGRTGGSFKADNGW